MELPPRIRPKLKENDRYKNSGSELQHKAQLYFKTKSNLKINYPPDPDRNRANTVDLRRGMAVRTLPREGAAKVNINS